MSPDVACHIPLRLLLLFPDVKPLVSDVQDLIVLKGSVALLVIEDEPGKLFANGRLLAGDMGKPPAPKPGFTPVNGE